MIVCVILLVVSFILDGVLTNFLPYSVGDLSLFTPLTSIVFMVVIYQLFYRQEKNYYIMSFILGFVYDQFYTNLLFVNGFLFLFIAFLTTKFYKMIGFNYLKIIFIIIGMIVIYEISFAILIGLFNLVPISVDRILYKIGHTLILNVIYGEILYFIIQVLPKKYKRVRIN